MARFLVVLDVDSTLIEDEVIELLADAAGSREAVAEVTFRAMNGELDFAESLRERVAALAGLPESVFAEVGARVTVTRGVPEMIASVQAAGGKVAVVSGGFHEIIDPLAERLGLDHWRANRLEVADGVLTGRVIPRSSMRRPRRRRCRSGRMRRASRSRRPSRSVTARTICR
ncbi:hypothetical protein GCM10025869_31420 [Homoserinibacter gongjuensis]|uniref:phosphoserine phosphatase n=1 Tax=Homoserinibacter gongjuensis TaxID=1162968 RepID=A0ABQ6JZ19_9MICO|nr:hypothetical protein GCM10025869_31420 [Homoserinibacter gongjuensis]